MSYNGSGTFNINTAGQPVVTGTVISSTAFNALTADLATGLSTAITKNGQTTVTANIPFNNFKLTGIGVATATGDALSYGQAATVTSLVASTSITDSGLTSGRLTYASTGGLLADSASLTWDGSYLTAASIKDTALTSGRVTYAGASGLLQDSANLTFNGTTLTANTIGAFTLSGTVAGGGNQLNNVIIGTTTPLAGAFTTLSATGLLTLTGTGTAQSVTRAAATASYITVTDGTRTASFGMQADNTMFVGARSAHNFDVYANNTVIGQFSSTGLAVTGKLSATTGAAVGGATAGAGGLAFPATAVAVADANTLDDYEEGTWTPNQGSGLTVVGAFSSSAVYTKIGNLVYVRGYVQGATSISIVAGGVLTSNLPFSNGSDACGGNCTNYNVNQTSGIYIQTGTSVNATSAITASQQVIFGFTYRV